MAWLTVLVSLTFLLGSSDSLRAAEPESFRVRSAVAEPPGQLSAVVVIPPGATPPATDFESCSTIVGSPRRRFRITS